MISEVFFATNYTSAWKTIAPTMDLFVRRMNMDGRERIWPPIESITEPHRRGLINEASFILFARSASVPTSSKLSDSPHSPPSPSEAFSLARTKIADWREDHIDLHAANESELAEIVVLSERLITYFRARHKRSLAVNPQFLGCGILSSCYGDVVADGRVLYEIKSGDRPFRSIDCRQIGVYLALNFCMTRTVFPEVAILNPRTGFCFSCSSDEFSHSISGLQAIDLCNLIISRLSSVIVSG